VRPSPTAGQASLEYIAVISLVAALLLAAPAVGASSLGREVPHVIRLGICLVARDYCRPGDAESARLDPCTLASRATGVEGGVTVGFVDAGGDKQWTATSASDGSITLARTAGVHGGLTIDTPPWRLPVSAGAKAGLRFQESAAWRFPDAASAKAFIRGLPASERTTAPYWTSHEGGTEAEASVKAALHATGVSPAHEPAVDVLDVSAAARLSDGVRIGPGSLWTVYGELKYSLPELKVAGVQPNGLGLGNGRVSLEYTYSGSRLIQLAIRTVTPNSRSNGATEVLRRLDLRDAGNAFVAQPLTGANMFRPPTPAYVRDLARVLRWIDSQGVVERSSYAVNDNSKSWGASVKLGAQLGISAGTIQIAQTLSDAQARVAGGPWHDRFDCLDQLR
jgi:hypothetical protein